MSIELLLNPLADELFAPVAAAGDASELSILDVAEGQMSARQAIRSAVRSARMGLSNPGAKACLILGDAGSGKSHVLTTVLKQLTSQSEVYPAVLQLSAPVQRENYDTWLVDAVVRQLSARHFASTNNNSPLNRLGEKLLDIVELEQKEKFLYFIDDLDTDDEISYALKLAHKIVRTSRYLLSEPPSARFIAALILASFGDYSALDFLRHGNIDSRLAPLELNAPLTPNDRFEVLRNIGSATRLASGCLVLAFDQVENTARLGSEGLFVHTITQAIRLAEDIPTCAVIIATLSSAYEAFAVGSNTSAGLPTSDRNRIEHVPPFPVTLEPGSKDFRRAVVAQRLSTFRERVKLEPCDDPLSMLPDWSISRIDDASNVRFALREVALFRSIAATLGRLPLLSDEPYSNKKDNTKEIMDPLAIDYDKEWADFQDTYTVTQKILDPVKASLISWWAQAANRERLNVDPIEPETHFLDDAFKTPVIDVSIGVGGVTIERRELALCEAPNRNQKLADQVEQFLAGTSAVPLVLRTNGFPKGRTAQVAPALKMLDHLFGTKLDLNETEWHNLNLAKEFFDKWHADAGFDAWQREKQWLSQLVSALQPLIAIPDVARVEDVDFSPIEKEVDLPKNELGNVEKEAGPQVKVPPDSHPKIGNKTLSAFPVLIGDSFSGDAVFWDPYRASPAHLNNFSFLVTGDAGSGKTQTIRSLIAAACHAEIGLTIFDFKGDYCASEFAEPLGINVIDVRASGLPFNPLQPPPRGASGTQPIEHAYEIASILKRVFKLGEVQEGLLRDAISQAYAANGIEPREWVDPDAVEWPSFDAVIERLKDGGRATAALVTKLSLLSDLGLFRLASGSSLASFLGQRSCLKLNELPSAEAMSVIAEILIVQLHGYALRGDQPRRLTRMMVFDEAHRVKDSKRLETLAREGRAFGVGIVIGTQFPGDIPETMAGNLATQLCLMNNQAQHRRLVVSQMLGTTSGSEAHALLDQLSHLRPLEGIFQNAHYSGTMVRVLPHYARTA